MSTEDYRLQQQLRNEAKLSEGVPAQTNTDRLVKVLEEIRDALLLTEAEKIARKNAITAQVEREIDAQADAQEEKDAQAERDAWAAGDQY